MIAREKTDTAFRPQGAWLMTSLEEQEGYEATCEVHTENFKDRSLHVVAYPSEERGVRHRSRDDRIYAELQVDLITTVTVTSAMYVGLAEAPCRYH